MPIIGKIHARLPYENVGNMLLGMVAMIDMNELMITQNILYLNITAEVTYLEDGETIDEFLRFEPYHIPIKRIGAGLTEDDYEIDFSKQDSSREVFLLQTSSFIDNQPKELRGYYIAFTNIEVVDMDKLETTQIMTIEKTIEELEEELEEAKGMEDYRRAARLRDMISKKKT